MFFFRKEQQDSGGTEGNGTTTLGTAEVTLTCGLVRESTPTPPKNSGLGTILSCPDWVHEFDVLHFAVVHNKKQERKMCGNWGGGKVEVEVEEVEVHIFQMGCKHHLPKKTLENPTLLGLGIEHRYIRRSYNSWGELVHKGRWLEDVPILPCELLDRSCISIKHQLYTWVSPWFGYETLKKFSSTFCPFPPSFPPNHPENWGFMIHFDCFFSNETTN